MTPRRTILVVVLSLVVTVLTPARATAAGTTVTVQGTTVTITVNIDLVLAGVDLGQEVPSEAVSAVAELEARVEAYWNAGFERLRYRDCLDLRLDLVITPKPFDYGIDVIAPLVYRRVTEPGHHVIVVPILPNRTQINDPYRPDLDPTSDYTTPFERDLDGVWDVDAIGDDVRAYAHEVGHLLGLGDDYRRDADGDPVALDGREGTLMGGGDQIDQALVNRVGDIAREVADIPGCEVWEGTWHDEHRNPDVVSTSDGTVTLFVAPDGSVKGEGSATQVTEGGSGQYAIELTGTRDEGAFHLTATGPGGSLDIDLAITGRSAEGTWSVSGGGTEYTGTISLECVDCDGPD